VENPPRHTLLRSFVTFWHKQQHKAQNRRTARSIYSIITFHKYQGTKVQEQVVRLKIKVEYVMKRGSFSPATHKQPVIYDTIYGRAEIFINFLMRKKKRSDAN
jgi:hypothetical protein